MIVFFSCLIPLIALSIILAIRKWHIQDENTLAYLATVPIILVITLTLYFIGKTSKTYYNECWNFKIVAINYYEDWDETVPCRHPKYRTETHTDSRGNTYTTTVFEGYEHFFDVDYHPECWYLQDEFGQQHGTNNATYREWRKHWNNEQFIDLNRSYYRNDGDMYQTKWTGEFNLIYPYSVIYKYKNKVRATNSSFGFAKVSKEIQDKYKRPVDSKNTAPIHAFGLSVDDDTQWMFRRLNANLGPSYKIHNLLLVFNAKDYPTSEIENIKNAWEGANKNELVTCVGIDPETNKVVWADVTSWMDNTTIHSLIRQDIFDMKQWSYMRFLDVLKERIPTNWKKKSFDDFEYLSVEVPLWVNVSSILISVIATAAGYIFLEFYKR